MLLRISARTRAPQQSPGLLLLLRNCSFRTSHNKLQNKTTHPKGCVVLLAGMARFELTDDGVKVRCLTAWLHPYIKIVKQQTKSL